MRKYKLFGKIPIFDLIIVVVLIVVAFVGFKAVNSSQSGVAYTTSETKEIVMTVKFTNISDTVKGEPKVGESVVETYTNNSLGTVISSKLEDYIVKDYSVVDGKLDINEFKDRHNIIVEIKTLANVSDINTSVNGTIIGIGKGVSFSMPSFSCAGTIIDIKGVND